MVKSTSRLLWRCVRVIQLIPILTVDAFCGPSISVQWIGKSSFRQGVLQRQSQTPPTFMLSVPHGKSSHFDDEARGSVPDNNDMTMDEIEAMGGDPFFLSGHDDSLAMECQELEKTGGDPFFLLDANDEIGMEKLQASMAMSEVLSDRDSDSNVSPALPLDEKGAQTPLDNNHRELALSILSGIAMSQQTDTHVNQGQGSWKTSPFLSSSSSIPHDEPVQSDNNKQHEEVEAMGGDPFFLPTNEREGNNNEDPIFDSRAFEVESMGGDPFFLGGNDDEN